MQTQRRTFPFFLVISLVFSAVFAGLGVWQLFRAQEKSQIQAQVDVRLQGASLTALPPLERGGEGDQETIIRWQFQPVQLTGVYLGEQTIFLDNIVQNRVPGYEVITPFKLLTGGLVLVDRGWVPASGDRRVLPEIQTPEALSGLNGVLYPPRSRPVVGGNGKPDLEHPKRWFFLDIPYFSQKIGTAVYPLLIHLDQADPNGFERNWAAFDAKVGMHIGYAIQWFVFSLFVFGSVVVLYRKRMVQKTE